LLIQINREEVGFMNQPEISVVETGNVKASIPNISRIADILRLDRDILFAKRGTFEALQESQLYELISEAIPNQQLIKICCYIFDAYFATYPSDWLAVFKNRSGLEYPDSTINILATLPPYSVLDIFSSHQLEQVTYRKEILKIDDQPFNTKVMYDYDRFHFFCEKAGIPFTPFNFFNMFHDISEIYKDLKYAHFSEWKEHLAKFGRMIANGNLLLLGAEKSVEIEHKDFNQRVPS